MTVNTNYEVSSEGAVRHWEIPQARLENTAPTVTQAAAVISLLPGTQLTGTVLTVDATDDIAVIDFTTSMVYAHDVRNVRTYNQAAEATWGVINIGDPIYYDGGATMVALGLFLSTSPLDAAGTANPLFGFAVPAYWDDVYPKGAIGAATATDVPVMQIGAGR